MVRTSDTPHATDVGDAKNLQHDEGCGCKTILLSLPDRSRIGEIQAEIPMYPEDIDVSNPFSIWAFRALTAASGTVPSL